MRGSLPGIVPKAGFRVWLTNFGYYIERRFDTFDEAVEGAKKTGFECQIWGEENIVVATWSPISGTRRLVGPSLL